MLIAETTKPLLMNDFKELMKKSDALLNEDASKRHSYYAKRTGTLLEDDVKAALDECAKGTPFQGTIEKISGGKFPDIIAGNPKIFGIEVKSTEKDHWVTTGSSILESTRVDTVERIYLTFGKLGGHIEFLSRPYEDCLYSIAVTHMPRYKIDMRLPKGESIFDKMQIPYDELRKMQNPVPPVAKYLRSQLKEGESLWWAGDSVEEEVSYKVRTWNNLSSEEQTYCIVYAFVHFPEIINGKYDNYSLWLASQGIVNSHLRDAFTAGGREEENLNGVVYRLPGIYRRIKNNKEKILEMLKQKYNSQTNDTEFLTKENEFDRKLNAWCNKIALYTTTSYRDIGYNVPMEFFKKYFMI